MGVTTEWRVSNARWERTLPNIDYEREKVEKRFWLCCG